MESPQINGNYYSFANIEFRVNGLFILGIKSINYGNKVGSTYVRGTNQMPLGTTQGQYEPKCDIEILRPQFNIFLAASGSGYMNRTHSITVSYGNFLDNGLLPTVTDLILGAKITDVDLSNSEGVEASAVKVTFLPMQIKLNGISAVNNGLPRIGAIG